MQTLLLAYETLQDLTLVDLYDLIITTLPSVCCTLATLAFMLYQMAAASGPLHLPRIFSQIVP